MEAVEEYILRIEGLVVLYGIQRGGEKKNGGVG